MLQMLYRLRMEVGLSPLIDITETDIDYADDGTPSLSIPLTDGWSILLVTPEVGTRGYAIVRMGSEECETIRTHQTVRQVTDFLLALA